MTTQAAAGNANVKALVYIGAFAPEAGEPISAYGDKYAAPLGAAVRPDAAGFLYIDRAQFHDLFPADKANGRSRTAFTPATFISSWLPQEASQAFGRRGHRGRSLLTQRGQP